MPHAPPETQNPRRVDRHPQARVEQRRFIEALNTFDNIKISETFNTNINGAETAISAALVEALRRKARAS
jgi:hypothetical protein